MVVVIRSGRGFQIEATCTGHGNGGHGCGAVLGLSREDLRWYGGAGSDWGADPTVCFRCPECGAVTDLALKDWPNDTGSLMAYSRTWARGESE